MTKETRGIDWAAIFKRRPDLAPPGYNELLTQIRKEQSDAQQQEGDD